MHIHFNLLGMKGLAFGTAAGVMADELARIGGAPLAMPSVSIGVVTGGFVAAVYGLLVDRSDQPGLWRSYWANFAQFTYELSGHMHPKYGCNPNRRLAYCGTPLAAYPLVVWVWVALFWVWQYFDNLKPDPAVFKECLTAATISIFFTWVIARATRDRRLIEPVEADPPRPNIEDVLALQSFLDGQSPSPGLRWLFASILAIGLLVSVLALSRVCGKAHATILALLGPIGIAAGLAGVIDPRVSVALQPGELVCPRGLRILASTSIVIGVMGGVGLAAFVLLH